VLDLALERPGVLSAEALKKYLTGYAPTPIGEKYGNGSAGLYVLDSAGYRNFARVYGEGEGSARWLTDVDDTSGNERRELYVDARDLARTVDGVTLSDADYDAALTQRGWEKLAEAREVAYAEATTSAAVMPGDIAWYDSGRWAASLTVFEATIVYEGGTVTRSAKLGTPPPTLGQRLSGDVPATLPVSPVLDAPVPQWDGQQSGPGHLTGGN